MKNWKTTIFGALVGAAMTGLQIYQQTAAQPGAPMDWKPILLGAGFAGLGYLAKDKDVTGGTVQQ